MAISHYLEGELALSIARITAAFDMVLIPR